MSSHIISCRIYCCRTPSTFMGQNYCQYCSTSCLVSIITAVPPPLLLLLLMMLMLICRVGCPALSSTPTQGQYVLCAYSCYLLVRMYEYQFWIFSILPGLESQAPSSPSSAATNYETEINSHLFSQLHRYNAVRGHRTLYIEYGIAVSCKGAYVRHLVWTCMLTCITNHIPVIYNIHAIVLQWHSSGRRVVDGWSARTLTLPSQPEVQAFILFYFIRAKRVSNCYMQEKKNWPCVWMSVCMYG